MRCPAVHTRTAGLSSSPYSPHSSAPSAPPLPVAPSPPPVHLLTSVGSVYCRSGNDYRRLKVILRYQVFRDSGASPAASNPACLCAPSQNGLFSE